MSKKMVKKVCTSQIVIRPFSQTRAYLHAVIKESAACHMITVHNVAFQLRLMRNIRESIISGKFPEFVQKFMWDNFPDRNYPKWVLDALAAVNVRLE